MAKERHENLLTCTDLMRPYVDDLDDPKFELSTLHVTLDDRQRWVAPPEISDDGHESTYANVLTRHSTHEGVYWIKVQDSFRYWECHVCQNGIILPSSTLSCQRPDGYFHRVCPICPKHRARHDPHRDQPLRGREHEISKMSMEKAWDVSQNASRRNTETSRSEHFDSKRVSFVEGSRIPQRTRSNSPEARARESSVTIGMDIAPWMPTLHSSVEYGCAITPKSPCRLKGRCRTID